MLYSTVTKKYASTQMGFDKVTSIIKLYDKTIELMRKAKIAIENQKFEERYNNIIAASEIIAGLQAALDFENGKDLSKMLDDYYFSIYIRMMNLNISNDIISCDSIVNELCIMQEAWNDIKNTSSLGSSNLERDSGDENRQNTANISNIC